MYANAFHHLSKEKLAAAIANADRKPDCANGDEAYVAVDSIANAQRSQSVSAEDAFVLRLIQAIRRREQSPKCLQPARQGLPRRLCKYDFGSVDVEPQKRLGLGVTPWQTETPAPQPGKSPTHLSNSSPQRRFFQFQP